MQKLIRMTDYLPEHPYSKFLKQKPELWMFVACDEDGNVLKEPKGWKSYIQVNGWKSLHPDALNRCSIYSSAKKRCLFEEFILKIGTENKVSNCFIDIQILNFSNGNKEIYLIDNTVEYPTVNKIYTVEDLVKYNPQLTPTAQKQIQQC